MTGAACRQPAGWPAWLNRLASKTFACGETDLLQVGIRVAGVVERLPAVHVRHRLGQVSHVDQRTTDIVNKSFGIVGI